MSNKQQEARAIHPEVLEKIPLKSILALLEVARDLRSGEIRPEQFDMRDYQCGTTYCIGGWAMVKLGHPRFSSHQLGRAFPIDPANLFAAYHPSTPKLAADAIERFVYENHPDPWLYSQNHQLRQSL